MANLVNHLDHVSISTSVASFSSFTAGRRPPSASAVSVLRGLDLPSIRKSLLHVPLVVSRPIGPVAYPLCAAEGSGPIYESSIVRYDSPPGSRWTQLFGTYLFPGMTFQVWVMVARSVPLMSFRLDYNAELLAQELSEERTFDAGLDVLADVSVWFRKLVSAFFSQMGYNFDEILAFERRFRPAYLRRCDGGGMLVKIAIEYAKDRRVEPSTGLVSACEAALKCRSARPVHRGVSWRGGEMDILWLRKVRVKGGMDMKFYCYRGGYDGTHPGRSGFCYLRSELKAGGEFLLSGRSDARESLAGIASGHIRYLLDICKEVSEHMDGQGLPDDAVAGLNARGVTPRDAEVIMGGGVIRKARINSSVFLRELLDMGLLAANCPGIGFRPVPALVYSMHLVRRVDRYSRLSRRTSLLLKKCRNLDAPCLGGNGCLLPTIGNTVPLAQRY